MKTLALIESIQYMESSDLLLIRFHGIESLHIVDHASDSIRAIKESSHPRTTIWRDLSYSSSTLILPHIALTLTADQLYDLVYKQKAGAPRDSERLI